MLSNEEMSNLFSKTLDGCTTLAEEYERIKEVDGAYQEELRRVYCNELLYTISQGYTKYNPDSFEKDEAIQVFCKAVKLLPKTHSYYYLLSDFFQRKYSKVLSSLETFLDDLFEESQKVIEETGIFFEEGSFIDYFFEPFKQGFPGFWNTLSKLLGKYPNQKGIPELCQVIDEYYFCNTDADALELLLNMMQKHPEFVLIKELIGYTYYSMKMWHNAIAYFEATEENGIFFTESDANFMVAWSYGKLKNHKLEESYYRKALNSKPNNELILNNLGYSLYLQKKYSKAKELFEKCFEINPNSPYAVNNYVRVLIALGRNKDAKSFVKSSNHKITKALRDKVAKLDNSNARIKKDTDEVVEKPIFIEEDFSQENAVDLGIKRQQFSNEKLLEDELTARIESGIEVFGKKLKMFKRKGVYGRQFIIPIGRLDLLCEDEDENLYIIELKKDSGYDDAYKQIAAYLDWFEKDEISKGKKVYGIICLNSPTQELIDKVRADNRIKLYEYQISYTEI